MQAGLWILLISGAAVIAAVLISVVRRRGDAPRPPAGAWRSDAVTPAGATPRGRVVERVARQGVLTQGVLVACEMAHSDGDFADIEAETIRVFILTHVPDADEAFARRILDDGIRERLEHTTLDNAIETIRALASEEQRRLVIELLVAVAEADGVVRAEEIAFMREVGAHLGLTRQAVDELLSAP